MDELEFRRRCIANPFDQDEAFQQMMQANPELKRFAQKQARFEAQLKEVMQSVVVPEGLTARIMLRHSMQRRRTKRWAWQRTLALAATISFIVFTILLFFPTEGDLKSVVLAHVNNELYHLTDQNDVQDAELKLLLKSVGGRLDETLGKINYAGRCNIRKHIGLHLVVEGEVGPITVLLMPGEDIPQRTNVADVRFKGMILPIPVGSAAILGEQGEPLEEFEQKLRNSVSWVST